MLGRFISSNWLCMYTYAAAYNFLIGVVGPEPVYGVELRVRGVVADGRIRSLFG